MRSWDQQTDRQTDWWKSVNQCNGPVEWAKESHNTRPFTNIASFLILRYSRKEWRLWNGANDGSQKFNSSVITLSKHFVRSVKCLCDGLSSLDVPKIGQRGQNKACFDWFEDYVRSGNGSYEERKQRLECFFDINQVNRWNSIQGKNRDVQMFSLFCIRFMRCFKNQILLFWSLVK